MGQLLPLTSMQGLLPLGLCLKWQSGLVWLHAVSDGVIGVSYFVIPLALGYFVSRRRDLAFGRIFWMFAIFILACGATHFLSIVTLWYPVYGLEGAVKAFCAVASVLTAIMLWPLVVRLMAYPTPAELRTVADQLTLREGERNQALRRLRQTEETFRFLVKGVTDYAIFRLDAGGRVETWNAGAERIKGYAESEILGRHFSAFYTQEDRDRGTPARVLETAAREGRFEGEGWRVRKDGSLFWASVVIDPLRDDAGQLVGYAKVTRDITERRRTAEALEQTRAALAQAQKMETVGLLAGGIAHDFNNLLTAIIGGASLLDRRIGGELNGEAAHILSSIRDSAFRAARLTHQLLAFSRKQALEPAVLDANKLLDGMAELLRRTLGESITITTKGEDGLWLTYADPNQLENVVLNLAVNARDAMPEGGTLSLETGNVVLDEAYAAANPEVRPGEYVMLAVGDTGTGMSEEVMARAFDPFFTTKPEGRGTGLGLSQAFGFIKQSGGHIKLASALGRGTTVKLYLPRHAAGEAAQTSRPPAYTNIPHGSEAVLVVEDHDNVRDFVTAALRHLGYQVVEASDGAEGLARLAANPGVAALLTDIGLPGINGRQLAREAVERAPGLKVLCMTAYPGSAIDSPGPVAAGMEVLPKPFTVEELARRLRQVLDRREPSLLPSRGW